MKSIYNYNNLKYSLEIAKLRLDLITKLQYKNCDDERLCLKTEISHYNKIIKSIDDSLSTLNNIELDLFKKITCENYNITNSVEKVANNYYLDTSTIWKRHYPKIKPLIEKLEKKEEI